MYGFFAKQKHYTLVNLIVALETIFLNMRRRNARFVVLIIVFAFGLPFETHEIKEMLPFCYVHSVTPCLAIYKLSTEKDFPCLLESLWSQRL